MKFLLLVFLFSCSREQLENPPSQKEYMASLPLESRVYIESCTTGRFPNKLDYCISRMKTDLAPKPMVIEKTIENSSGDGTSIIKTAVGTAVGYGAVKLLTGKRK